MSFCQVYLGISSLSHFPDVIVDELHQQVGAESGWWIPLRIRSSRDNALYMIKVYSPSRISGNTSESLSSPHPTSKLAWLFFAPSVQLYCSHARRSCALVIFTYYQMKNASREALAICLDVMVELINYSWPPYTTTRVLLSNKTRDELIALDVGGWQGLISGIVGQLSVKLNHFTATVAR